MMAADTNGPAAFLQCPLKRTLGPAHFGGRPWGQPTFRPWGQPTFRPWRPWGQPTLDSRESGVAPMGAIATQDSDLTSSELGVGGFPGNLDVLPQQ
jgi:hypothetical protein